MSGNIYGLLKKYIGVIIICCVILIYTILFILNVNTYSITDNDCNFNIKGNDINKESIYNICYTLGCDIEMEDEDTIEHKCVKNVNRSIFSIFFYWLRTYWINILLLILLFVGITIQTVKYNVGNSTPAINPETYFNYV